MASKTVERLRAVRVFNAYGFYDETPYIWRRVRDGSRDVFPSAWLVTRRGLELGTGAWHEQGARWFSYSSSTGSRQAFAEALAWASKLFGVAEWSRDPFGSYGPADYVQRRLAALVGEEKRDG